MRFGAGFGILSLLVVVAIGIVWYSQTQIPVARTGRQAQQQSQQIAGRDAEGRPVTETYTAEGIMKNGKMNALKVKSVIAGGAIESSFGLKKDDEIIQIGEQTVDSMGGDEQLANGQILEAYRRSWPLVVLRGGEKVTLTPKGGGGRGPLGGLNLPGQ